MVPEFNLGDRLRKARELSGISVGQMADELGVDRTSITRYERGKLPRRAIVMAYALRCDVPVEWLEEGMHMGVTGQYRDLVAA